MKRLPNVATEMALNVLARADKVIEKRLFRLWHLSDMSRRSDDIR
jgi:hypothetical protein